MNIFSDVHLGVRTDGRLGVRYDQPRPGHEQHFGGVSLELSDGAIFALFRTPEDAKRLGRELYDRAVRWEQDLNGDAAADGAETDVRYPDPDLLREQAIASAQGAL
ncbi:hypothetical protein NDR87_26200 [Nocardia sp. CDC159]|uniref:Uncharacterized protein n=1 Tax=Nocardia pulmonis TaxID=2951408 RepID=A0A9X2IXS4_9NOCA|nr:MULTISPECIES: hypothetical protein [Nocardia]MCM6774939.1 hypothetical protein [Nocardia pulmonis]MCM6789870.1 hypothetical protein [Nocardia sp. CDC159]